MSLTIPVNELVITTTCPSGTTVHNGESLTVGFEIGDTQQSSLSWFGDHSIILDLVNEDGTFASLFAGYGDLYASIFVKQGYDTIPETAMIPVSLAAGTYRIRASIYYQVSRLRNRNSIADGGVLHPVYIYGYSDPFTVEVISSIVDITVADGDLSQAGDTTTVTWTATGWGSDETIDIYVRNVTSGHVTKINDDPIDPSDETFDWRINTTLETGSHELCFIETGIEVDTDLNSFISEPFTITQRSITFTAPAAGDIFLTGSESNTVAWTPTGFITNEKLFLYYRRINATDWTMYGGDIDATAGTMSDLDFAADAETGEYQLQARDEEGNEYTGPIFEVGDASVTINTPSSGSLFRAGESYSIKWSTFGYADDATCTVWQKKVGESEWESVLGMDEEDPPAAIPMLLSEETCAWSPIPTVSGAYQVKIIVDETPPVAYTSGTFSISSGVADYNATVRRTAAYAVAGGKCYWEGSEGTFTRVDVGDPTPANAAMATDAIIADITAYQKVFFADGTYQGFYVMDPVCHKINVTSSLATDLLIGQQLVDTNGANLIIDRFTRSSLAITLYVFHLNSIAIEKEFSEGVPTTIVTTDANGDAVTLTYGQTSADIVAPTTPHWSKLTARVGEMPLSSNIGCQYRGRLVFAKDHMWYMSRQGDAFDWDYVADDPQTAIAGTDETVARVGDIITALIPFNSDQLLLGCERQIWMMRGDPAAGGSMDNLTSGDGIFGSKSWCFDSANNLYFMGMGGLYVLANGSSSPENVSGNKVPELLKGIARSTHIIGMAFDVRRNGIIIYVTNATKTSADYGVTAGWWYDVRTQGFFPESYPQGAGVFSAMYYGNSDNDYDGVILGCNDGCLRTFDNTKYTDTNSSGSEVAVESFITYSAQPIANISDHGKVTNITIALEDGTNQSLDVEVYATDTAKQYMNGSGLLDTLTLTTGGFHSQRVRGRGQYAGLVVRCDAAADSFMIETIALDILPGGRLRT